MGKTLLIIEKNPSGSVGLVKAKERGLHVIFVGSNKYDNRLTNEDRQYVDSMVEIDVNDGDRVVQEVQKIHRQTPIDGVITFMEYHVVVTATIAKTLGLTGISPESARRSRNKFLMREAFAQADVPIPRYRLVKNYEEAKEFAPGVGFPNIIKPVNLAGSRGVFKNSNLFELREHCRVVSDAAPPFGVPKEDVYLLEEYMDGPEFSIESVSYGGEVVVAAITKKIIAGHKTFVEVGHVVPADLEGEREKGVVDVAKRAVLALGIFNGTSHAEVKLTSAGPKVVEVAARLGGDHIPELVELASGIDLWDAAISISLGERPDLTRTRRRSAAISYLVAEPGVIATIGEVDPTAEEEVVATHIRAKIGDRVGPLSNSSDRLGYTIATGRTPEEAELHARRASDAIKIMTTAEVLR